METDSQPSASARIQDFLEFLHARDDEEVKEIVDYVIEQVGLQSEIELAAAVLPSLKPILDRKLLVRDRHGNPTRTWTTGQVMRTFFDRKMDWFYHRVKEGFIDEADLPPVQAVSGGASGNRQWTLPDVEGVAFTLFHSTKVSGFDAAALLRTLDVIYAEARLHGLLPLYEDPIAMLRPKPPTAVIRKR